MASSNMTGSHSRKLWPVVLLLFYWLACSPALGQEKLGRTLNDANVQLASLLIKDRWALLFSFLTIYPLLMFIAWLLTKLLQWAFRQRRFTSVPWGGKQLLLFGLLYFLAQLLGYSFLASLLPGDRIDSLSIKLLFYCCLNIAFCGGLVWALKCFGGPNSNQWLGWQSPGGKGVLAVSASYLLFLPWFFLSFVVSNLLCIAFGIKPEPQQVAQEILQVKGMLLWLGIATMVIVAPLSEEILFRMFLYSGLRRIVKPAGAMVLSAAIFAIVHQNIVALLPIFVLGIFFSILYEESQSLWVPALAHAIHNGLTLIYLLNFV